ncbi:reactive intermediate/imine deaminase [Carnobacterium maltaromaticum]|uniref:RidA family protein n=1 Tax=Carnobacterium maltaromaticum TaxID=2751 RepID=UPI000C76FC96|nr:RidA family protein [Carnobacterium maltaromaticum]PLS33062.1 reactive intermediate/imine deaminase [Carnobacterium maltaromaticum]PLS33527.1 reactive intermediate/imine deaminase [Carnobacterium maltaromaticum]PLS33637.1 reactive intermediate/imine deaminase [Carnobacterium maltaromaticum]PLS41328.1 reactive intermediate/imine deaminase [Carnobacterium maltaromaticum]PLS42218.1 reactive intermediate/imine deaminase [Carnobacterium maltaromaticum]
MLEKIYTDQAPAAIGPYSQAIKIENILYTSGQIPVDPTTGKVISTEIIEQAQQVMKNLQAVLEEGGANLNSVIKTTCFLTDMADFAAFNEVYGSYFGDHKPARSCVAVKELPLNVRVEVEAIAVI